MAVHAVFLYASAANPSNLILSDDENHVASSDPLVTIFTTQVSTGDILVWALGKSDTAVNAITSFTITPKAGWPNLFSQGPFESNAHWVWAGIIGDLAHDSQEAYNISYVVNGQTYVKDPRLKMN